MIWQLEFLAVTRGEEGITLFDDHNEHHIAATAKQVFDVSGAGDTVIATLAGRADSWTEPPRCP
jgi:D-beta-D-heptose 7-phosphate kinase/D-beta-D-heptose 1-phosphate adenosyltransferase